jgi:hypothetical protein
MNLAAIKKTNRKLEQRIKSLEDRRGSKSAWPLLVWGSPVPEASRALGPEERLVYDWYRDLGGIVLARPRITADPNDLGQQCRKGGCLIDVIRELHEECPNRHLGSCAICSGLDLQAEADDATQTIVTSAPPRIRFKPPQWVVFNCHARFRVLVAGRRFDFVVLDEFASMAPEAWTEVLRPALADRQGRALFIGTPQGYNHFHDVYSAAQGQSDWAGFQFSTEEGGNVPAEELARAAEQLDKRVYQQEFCASFENLASGRAYYAFDRTQDVKGIQFDPRHPLIWVLDFNVDPGCSLLAQTIPSEIWDPAVRATLRVRESRVHVLEEIVLRNSNTYEVCKEFARRTENWAKYLPAGFPKLRVEVYGDAAGENRTASAPRTSWQIVKDFFDEHSSSHSVTYRYSTRNPLVRDRVNCVNAMFCDAGDRRSITVSPNCKELIRDLEQVCWHKDANGNDTRDLDKSNAMRTHTSDALGYFIAQKFPMPSTSNWPTSRPLY